MPTRSKGLVGFPRRVMDPFNPNAEGLARTRFGRGVVGNTTFAMAAFCCAIGTIAWALRNSPAYDVGAIGIMGLIFFLYLRGTHRFADKHPDLAALGDSEWLRLQQMQWAARGVGHIPEMPSGTESDSLSIPIVSDDVGT